MAERAMMPEPAYRSTSLASPLDQLIGSPGRGRYADMYDPDSRWLLGTRLPPFQRPHVWSEAQSVRFVESAWMGFNLGSWMVNRWDRLEAPDRFHRTDLWLIDGQQRLTALAAYVADAFPVFGHRWSEITDLDRRRFGSITFTQSRVSIPDEAKLRELYDRLNYGGTGHLPEQKACAA